MRIIFTYLPIRLKEITEIYLKYSIEKLNKSGVVPIIYSDEDYFLNEGFQYDWIRFNVDEKYKKNNLWSYPKLKVLSLIPFPFIHLDNDLIVEDFNKLKSFIDPEKLNLCYKHPLRKDQTRNFEELYKKYSSENIGFNELNNTSIIATKNYLEVNKTYQEVIDVIDSNYDFFTERYNGIPPITLNQQHLNLRFKEINYLFKGNPSFREIDNNGICHMDEKNIPGFLLKKLI